MSPMLSRMPVKPPVLSPADCKKVIAALKNIIAQAKKGAFKITLADQDVHLAVERTLTAKLGDLGKKVHTGRSRNDQVAVDLRLYAKEQILCAIGEAAALAAALLDFAKKHAADPMVGRTHMQPAMPSSVGLWASAHAESLLDDVALLMAAYELNDQCPLGSAASYGVPLPIDRQLVSDLLGFSRPVHNVLYANNARGKMESVILLAMGQVMLTLSRLAQDLILFTMPEFGYFTLPAAFCTGSSIMPQKRNPDVLELVRGKAVESHGVRVVRRRADPGRALGLQPGPAGGQGAVHEGVPHDPVQPADHEAADGRDPGQPESPARRVHAGRISRPTGRWNLSPAGCRSGTRITTSNSIWTSSSR